MTSSQKKMASYYLSNMGREDSISQSWAPFSYLGLVNCDVDLAFLYQTVKSKISIKQLSKTELRFPL